MSERPSAPSSSPVSGPGGSPVSGGVAAWPGDPVGVLLRVVLLRVVLLRVGLMLWRRFGGRTLLGFLRLVVVVRRLW